MNLQDILYTAGKDVDFVQSLIRSGKFFQPKTGFGKFLQGITSGMDSLVTAGTNWFNAATGNGLTDAQNAQNAFNANEAQKNRDFQADMANTQYQRGVADMQAAGINPALAMTSGANPAPTPSGSTASAGSVQPTMGFQELLSALMLPLQMEQMRANIANTKSDTNVKDANAQNIGLDNKFLSETMNTRIRSIELSNNLSEENIGYINSQRSLIAENIKKVIAETRTEEERKTLVHLQGVLANAQADQIAALLPYQKLLMEAQTENQKANALSSFIHAMYEKKLIDAGFIETQIDTMKKQAVAALTSAAASMKSADAQAKMAEVNSAMQSMKNSMLHGTFFEDIGAAGGSTVIGKALSGALGVASALSTAIAGPLTGLSGFLK